MSRTLRRNPTKFLVPASNFQTFASNWKPGRAMHGVDVTVTASAPWRHRFRGEHRVDLDRQLQVAAKVPETLFGADVAECGHRSCIAIGRRRFSPR